MVKIKLQIPEDFLKEEVRCGYTVTAAVKEIWAVELDLLNELLRVCEKYKIKIYAYGGTLLGAVRHKGFIPWDDDIDMHMHRKDYDILCRVAKWEFKEPYFFQTEYTDHGSLRGHAQLRNSQTTGILKQEEGKFRFHQGIFIDIFPLDHVVDDEKRFNRQKRKIKAYRKLAHMFSSISTRYYKRERCLKGIIKAALYLLFNHMAEKMEIFAYKKFENACRMHDDEETERVSALFFDLDNEKRIFFAEDFAVINNLKFEFLEIPAVSNYERILRTCYGDYMVFKKESSSHGEVIFDTEKPYTEYL